MLLNTTHWTFKFTIQFIKTLIMCGYLYCHWLWVTLHQFGCLLGSEPWTSWAQNMNSASSEPHVNLMICQEKKTVGKDSSSWDHKCLFKVDEILHRINENLHLLQKKTEIPQSHQFSSFGHHSHLYQIIFHVSVFVHLFHSGPKWWRTDRQREPSLELYP